MHSSLNPAYFAQLHRYLESQTERIRQLELKVESMGKEIDALRQQRSVVVEKIEYKFDQLKVEKLEGSMSIGLSPSGINGKSIEELAVEGQVIQTNTSRSESFERIQNAVFTFLEADCSDELGEIEQKYGIHLGTDLKEQIVEDLLNQASVRIEHYLDSAITDQKPMLQPQEEQELAQRVIEDIRAGINQYMQAQVKQKEEADNNETDSGK